MGFYEKQLSSQTIFEGTILTVKKDQVELEDGTRAHRELVENNGGVCVLAFNEKGEVLLVRQYRYAMGREMLELPAGKLERGEEPCAAALRELEEETGYRCEELIDLGLFYPSVAYLREAMYMFAAVKTTPTTQHLDEGEFLSVEAMPLEKLVEKILSGEIKDGKTCLATLKFWAEKQKASQVEK